MATTSNALKSIDQFKMVSRDLTQSTAIGGLFTAIAYAALIVLICAETADFFRTAYQTQVVMDENRQELMRINFDISLFDLPCKYLQLHVFDKFGEERIAAREGFHYLPLDHNGDLKGQAYTPEEITALEHMDLEEVATDEEKAELEADWASSSDHFKHHDFKGAVTFHEFTFVNFYAEWCVHCREFHPTWVDFAKEQENRDFVTADGLQVKVKFLKINCVDFQAHCQDAQIAAFPTLRLYKQDGSFEGFQKNRNKTNLADFLADKVKNSHKIVAKHHNIFKEGCQVIGSLQVPRVPGHFHLQAEAMGKLQINPGFTNVSHIVNHLSFGDKDDFERATRLSTLPTDIIKHLNPLDGQTFVVKHFHEAPQHFLKVVSTHVEGKQSVHYQMTHTDRTRQLQKKSSIPQARFSYDFSPMSVVVKTRQKRWYEFLTSMMAILGGTYTILELCSGAVETVQTTVKEVIGKAE